MARRASSDRHGEVYFFVVFNKREGMPRPRLERAVAILHQQGAAAALSELKNSMKSYNANSFCSLVYSVRSLYYERYGPPPGYTAALAALRAAVHASSASNEVVHDFLARNYREQRACAKSLCASNRSVSSDPAVRRAYTEVCAHMEHKNLESFRPTPKQLKEKQEATEKARQLKSSAGRKVVPDGDACVSWCVDVFQQVNQGQHMHEEMMCVALLLTTGRRTSEIHTGLSTFEPVGASDETYHVRFSGQLKTVDKSSYCFQALLPYSLWKKTYQHFHTKYATQSQQLKLQNRDSQVEDAGLAERLRRIIRYEFRHPSLTAHDLRAMYARIAYVRFEHEATASFSAFARVQLGHKHLGEPATYDRVHVNGLRERRPDDRVPVDYINGSCQKVEEHHNTSHDPSF